MNVLRHKIWYDLWANKARTLQVVLIIGMGAFALGMIIGTRDLVIQGMNNLWAESSPPMIGLWASPPISDDTLNNLKRIDGVQAIEGYADTTIEWQDKSTGEWLPANLIARSVYQDQKFGMVNLISGAWPDNKTIALGQGSDAVFGIQEGDKIALRVDGRIREYELGGTIYDPNMQPPSFGGNALFFANRDTFEYLTGSRNYNRIFAGAAIYDEPTVIQIADAMTNKLEKQDVASGGFLPPDGGRFVNPNKHFFQETMDGIFLVLGVMAILALGLGLSLVYNTINAIITQQVDQIGVMKAIGATTQQILVTYLLYVFAFGILALLIAIPLGIAGSLGLTSFLMNSFNAEVGAVTISSTAIIVQVAIALLAPLLVAIIPVINGARVTVREAISTYGLSSNTTMLDRLIARLQRVSRLLLLTISNTFRHKGRVILTQITLVLSGLVFIMVMGVRDSTRFTFNDVLFTILNSNINLVFEDEERIIRVEDITRTHPGVKAVEIWELSNVSARPSPLPESDDDPGALIFGVPPQTTLYGYQMRDGRWLAPTDEHTIVLNQNLASELGVAVGDTVTLNHGGHGDVDWLIVGTLFDPLITNSAHVPRDVLLREENSVGRANSLWIQTTNGQAEFEKQVATELRQQYEAQQIAIASGGVLAGQDTSSEVKQIFNTQFAAIITLLATMAVVIGIVGSISLSGVLSLNVIERQREIGVMRAIGASSRDMSRLFVGEGLILAWLSWLIAMPLSVPAGKLMTTALSAALDLEIVYHYSPTGALMWLGIITVLAVFASWFPARAATKVSVRESLAYQ